MLSSLVIATHNAGKLKEIRELLAPFGFPVTSVGELGLPEPAETGNSFVANAEIKSKAAALASGKPSLSDDSGLCVEALNGDPGVYSADWAGAGKDFTLAIGKVKNALDAAGATPPYKAYFVCVLSLCDPQGRTINFEGKVHGSLVFPPRGKNGFGYDPIFVADGHSQTFGEMVPEEKHAISHRARAFARFTEYLRTQQVKYG